MAIGTTVQLSLPSSVFAGNALAVPSTQPVTKQEAPPPIPPMPAEAPGQDETPAEAPSSGLQVPLFVPGGFGAPTWLPADEASRIPATLNEAGAGSAGERAGIRETRTPGLYSTVDAADPRFYVRVGLEDGELSGTMRTVILDDTTGKVKERSTVLLGHVEFERAMTHFEGRFERFKALWVKGTNLNRFNDLIRQGYTPAKAAAGTWTGEQLTMRNFLVSEDEIKLGERDDKGNYTSVEVMFRRQP